MNGSPTVELIDSETLKSWIASGDAVIVDVREAHEHDMARIEGSTLTPLSAFDPMAIPEHHHNKKLVIHCASGVRCGMASQKLIEAGYTGQIHRLQGGIEAWYLSGGLIEQG